jgi:hypothetical protein
MFLENHPLFTTLGSAAAVTALTLLAGAVTDPLALAGLLTAGVASSISFGLGLATLLAGDSPSAREEDADPPQPRVSLDLPVLPPPARPEGPDSLFAQRLQSERDAAPRRRR